MAHLYWQPIWGQAVPVWHDSCGMSHGQASCCAVPAGTGGTAAGSAEADMR